MIFGFYVQLLLIYYFSVPFAPLVDIDLASFIYYITAWIPFHKFDTNFKACGTVKGYKQWRINKGGGYPRDATG